MSVGAQCIRIRGTTRPLPLLLTCLKFSQFRSCILRMTRRPKNDS